MDLLALTDFNVVAQHGGFGRASRITGIPKATLSRRVRQLEDELGVRLMERGARTLRLTEEGQQLQQRTSSLLESIDEVAEDLRTGVGKPRGRLRISAPVLFAHRGLGRIAANYAAAYPDVQLEVIAEDRFADPQAETYDLIIRANPDPSTDLSGRCFLRDELIVVAAPALRRPANDDETVVPAIVLPGTAVDLRWQLKRADGLSNVHAKATMQLSSMAMIYDAVLAGAGAAAMPRSLVQVDLDAGRLVDWGVLIDRHIEVWALYPSHRHISAKVAAFVQILIEQFFDATPAGFESLKRFHE